MFIKRWWGDVVKRFCVKCWRNEHECTCASKNNIVLLDKNIIDILVLLNNKGYKTRFSCGGHASKKYIFIYINFYDEYVFDNLPGYFTYEGKRLFYRNIKEKEKQKDIDHKIGILKDWAEQLRKLDN